MNSQFQQNMSRLESANREALSFSTGQRTQSAKLVGDQMISEADKLAKFSSTLATELHNRRLKHNEKEEIEGNRHFDEWTEKDLQRKTRIAALRSELALISKEDATYASKANELRHLLGVQAEEKARFVESLSPHRQVGFAKRDLKNFNERLPSMLKHRMMTSNTRMSHGGVEFSPAEIHGDATALQFKMAGVHTSINQIAREQGINNYSDELLHLTGTRQAIQTTRNKFVTDYQTQYAIDNSAKVSALAYEEFLEHKDLAAYLNKVEGTYDKKGKLRGWTGAWDEFEKVAEMAVMSGELGMADILALEQQEVPGRPGVKYGDAKSGWKYRFDKIKHKIAQANQKRYNQEVASDRMAYRESKEALKEQIKENPIFAEAENYNAWKADMNEKYNITDFRDIDMFVKNQQNVNNPDYYDKEAQDAILAEKARRGTLTEEDLEMHDAELQNRYRSQAQALDKMRAAPGYTKAKENLKKEVMGHFDLGVDDEFGVDQGGIYNEVMADFNARIVEYTSQKNIADAAGEKWRDGKVSPYDAAIQETQELFWSQTKEGGRYYINPKSKTRNKLDNYNAAVNPKSANKTTFEKHSANIIEIAREKNINYVLDTPELLFSTEELLEIGDPSTKYGQEMDPRLTYWAKKFNTDPWTILNRVREANKLPALPIPEAYKPQQEIDPEVQHYLNGTPIQKNRVQSTISEDSQISLVPYNRGEQIAQYAALTNVPFSISAAALESEGASQGINPWKTMDEVDIADKAENFAAVWNQSNGSFTTAAVLSGLDAANFTKTAAKYGNKEALLDASSMRPAIATQVTNARLGDLSSTLTYGGGAEVRMVETGDYLINLGYTPKQHPTLEDGTSDGRSLDFRTSENSEEQLDTLYNYLNMNKACLGISNLLWKTTPESANNLHVDFDPHISHDPNMCMTNTIEA